MGRGRKRECVVDDIVKISGMIRDNVVIDWENGEIVVVGNCNSDWEHSMGRMKKWRSWEVKKNWLDFLDSRLFNFKFIMSKYT